MNENARLETEKKRNDLEMILERLVRTWPGFGPSFQTDYIKQLSDEELAEAILGMRELHEK